MYIGKNSILYTPLSTKPRNHTHPFTERKKQTSQTSRPEPKPGLGTIIIPAGIGDFWVSTDYTKRYSAAKTLTQHTNPFAKTEEIFYYISL
jgi:hypothetical protein